MAKRHRIYERDERGHAVLVKEVTEPTEEETRAAKREALKEQTVDTLAEQAAAAGIEVKRGDGDTSKRPTKDDYLDALS